MSAVPVASVTPRDGPGRAWGVWCLVAVMCAAGVPLAASAVSGHVLEGLLDPTWWALVPVFALGEALVIHVPTLRNAHTHTLREVPAVVGLALLAPAEYIAAYLVGCALGLAFGRRQRGVKLAFNASMFVLEASIGVLTYQAVLGAAAPGDPRGWLAAFTAVLVTDLLSAVAVTAAISLTEDRFDRDVLRDAMGSGLVAAMVNTCLALIVVVLLTTAPVALPLLGAAVGMLVLGYRAHVALGAGYSRLQHLYRFVGSTEQPADLPSAVRAILGDARRVLRADAAELLILPTETGAGTCTAIAPDGSVVVRELGRSEIDQDAWWSPAAAGEAVLRQRSTPRGARPDTDRDGIAAPLRSEGEVYAVLVVRDRSFQGETFTAQDLRLFETLAAHAAVALEKARLVDRLRRLAAQREHEARHDPLTGLPNRRAFQESVSTVIAAGGTGAVLFLDLDDFKDVNDTLGHGAGDVLLVETGRRLQSSTDGFVARLGGDEFALLLPGHDARAARESAQRLLEAVTEPVSVHRFTLRTAVSIGIALLPDHGRTTDEALQHADVAMYTAKAAGSGVEVYRPEDGRAVQRKMVLAADLPAAIADHGFEVWYQPQADARTGHVVGAEALLRWNHPRYGWVPPPDVIAVAERTGLLRQLTDAVLERALHQRATWAAAGLGLNMSVNITAADLHDERLPEVVQQMLTATTTPAQALTLEITESGVMSDPARCLTVLDRLARLGVRLAVDDFGTGYSSLAYLERLPVREVKIDKSFVQALDDGSTDATVIRATVSLAHDLGMQVVAEGIESPDAWSRVAALGCEMVQGYALARPLPARDFLPWLREHQAVHEPGPVSHGPVTSLALLEGSTTT